MTAFTRPSTEGGAVASDEHAAPETEFETSSQKKLGVMGGLAVIWLVLVMIMAIAPGIFPYGELGERNLEVLRSGDLSPRLNHPFGFNTRGADYTAQVIHGTRASIIVSVGATLIGLVIGGFLGLVAGYFHGKTDTVLTNLFNILLSVPALVLALTFAAVLSPGSPSQTRRLVVVTLAMGIVSIPVMARIARANTLVWSEREFVIAAQAMGARSYRVLISEVLPNVLPALLSLALLGVAVAIIVEGGLAVIGVGIPPGIHTPSWGNLLATGRVEMLSGYPHLVLAPSLVIFLTVLTLNYLGDIVRARFDVRESLL